nr:ribonuclease H-like domain, reverse transcriptase, RNA-dependent DNA polymerase [Tanacetum cinerariifolium]
TTEDMQRKKNDVKARTTLLLSLPNEHQLRIDMINPWTFDFGIFVEFDFDHWARKSLVDARLVAQGHTQEEGIDYEEVFAPVTRIEAIRLFLAYASFMGFTVYQMDVKSDFLYGTIDEEVYVMQPLGLQDPEFPARVYKVEKAMYGLHQAPRACSTEEGWHFSLSRQGKDETGKDVDLHLYRSMVGSLRYITASRPDIMFAVCACARHQVTPKECRMHAVKRIFRYLKGHPKLGLWYPKESPFDLVAYSDSDYGVATQDRKSTTEGC